MERSRGLQRISLSTLDSDVIMLMSSLLQVWFDRRTNYTRSLAVMSMVGYILGLGDRSVFSAKETHCSF